jgi:hypothetical protein
MSGFAEERRRKGEKDEEEDVFWSLVDSNDHSLNKFCLDPLNSHIAQQTGSSYKPKTFFIASKRDPFGLMNSPSQQADASIYVFLGEMKEEGCLSDIGGVMWEASVLLCCFVLSHQEVFIPASVLELGAGVGLPGLLLAVLKRNYLDQMQVNRTSTAQEQEVSVGSVCLSDYDSDVLDNLVCNIYHQFCSTCDVLCGPCDSSRASSSESDSSQVSITVKQLDWTDDAYQLQSKDVHTHRTSCGVPDHSEQEEEEDKGEEERGYSLLIGSELIYMSSLAPLANVIL